LAAAIRATEANRAVQGAILAQPTVVALRRILRPGMTDKEAGVALGESLGYEWKATSAQRVASGLRRFLEWCEGGPVQRRRLRKRRGA
jgi:hypothetical protein